MKLFTIGRIQIAAVVPRGSCDALVALHARLNLSALGILWSRDRSFAIIVVRRLDVFDM